MGEIANSLINGEFDFHTGEYLGKPVGHPRTLDRSLSWEKRSFTKTNQERGVRNWLSKNSVTDALVQSLAVKKWAADKGIELSENKSITDLCVEVQKDFRGFCEWFKVNEKYYLLNGK